MSKDTEKANNPDDNERVTIARLTESYLSSGKARTKEEAKAKARLEVAKVKASQAKDKLKSIEEAKKKLEREQARKERFAKSKNERKARTKLLIEAGGLIAKAGLLDWDAATLLGVLISAREIDDSTKSRVRAIGAKALNHASVPAAPPQAQEAPEALASRPDEMKKAPEAPKVPMLAVAVETPQGRPTAEITKSLREMGLSWQDVRYDRVATSGSEIQKSWQGYIPADKIDVVRMFVESWGGLFIVIK